MSKPLKTGAKYMTELCSVSKERRGTGLNRGLLSLISYVKYQLDPEVRKQNEKVMNEVKFKELYEEIARILPSLEYCLAPRKVAAKEGAASLRGSVAAPAVSEQQAKSPTELDKHAKCIFEWLDPNGVSRIRMLLHWQSAGGLSHVGAVYHRSMQCFLVCGNKLHEGIARDHVTLEEFQEGIRCRHDIGDAGMDDASQQPGHGRDFS